MTSRFRIAFAVALAAGTAVLPASVHANGQPVVSLELAPLGRTGIWVYSDRASPLVSLPVRRASSNGENTEIEYDTTAQPMMVTSCPNPRSVGSGENSSIECDETAAAAAPHTMPNVGGGHNSALWNLRHLPPSIR